MLERLSAAQLGPLLKALRGDTLIAAPVLLPALERSFTPEAAPAILDYLAEALRTGWRPSIAELDQALKVYPSSFQERTDALRALFKSQSAEQAKRLARFESFLSGGDPERGKLVFFGKKVACATCHRVGAEGGIVGPDLTKVGAIRSGRDILESVLLPSSTIAQGFDPYWLMTNDGRILTGVIARPTADVLLVRDSSGGETRLRQDQVQEMRRLSTSLMPEGLERALNDEEFRDLLAFLQRLR